MYVHMCLCLWWGPDLVLLLLRLLDLVVGVISRESRHALAWQSPELTAHMAPKFLGSWGGTQDGWCLTLVDRGPWWLLVQFQGCSRAREGLRWLASANRNTPRVEDGRMFKESLVAVLAIGFVSGKICWVCLQSRSLWNTVISTANVLVTASAFPPWFCWLCKSQLCCYGWGKVEADHCTGPQKDEEAICFSFLG